MASDALYGGAVWSPMLYTHGGSSPMIATPSTASSPIGSASSKSSTGSLSPGSPSPGSPSPGSPPGSAPSAASFESIAPSVDALSPNAAPFFPAQLAQLAQLAWKDAEATLVEERKANSRQVALLQEENVLLQEEHERMSKALVDERNATRRLRNGSKHHEQASAEWVLLQRGLQTELQAALNARNELSQELGAARQYIAENQTTYAEVARQRDRMQWLERSKSAAERRASEAERGLKEAEERAALAGEGYTWATKAMDDAHERGAALARRAATSNDLRVEIGELRCVRDAMRTESDALRAAVDARDARLADLRNALDDRDVQLDECSTKAEALRAAYEANETARRDAKRTNETCVVCVSRPRDCVVVGMKECRHLALCSNCARETDENGRYILQQCPICQERVRTRLCIARE
jgi:hypothetical protein